VSGKPGPTAPDENGLSEAGRALLNVDKAAVGLLRARLFGLRHGFLIAASMCMAVAILGVVVWLFYYDGLSSIALDREGRQVDGVLADIRFVKKPFAAGWSLHYVFEVAGRTMGGVSYWSGKRLPDDFKVGAPVTVELLPGRESKANRVRGTQLELTSPFFFPLLWISGALGVLLAAVSALLARRDQRILETGSVCEGVIRSRSAAVRLRFFGLPPARFNYAYSDERGDTFSGRIISYYPEAVLELLPGDAVTVFYNPRKPKVSIMVDALIGPGPLRAALDDAGKNAS